MVKKYEKIDAKKEHITEDTVSKVRGWLRRTIQKLSKARSPTPLPP